MERLEPKYKNTQQNIALKVLNVLVDYESDIKVYNNAIEDFNELGGLDGIAKIMKWDYSQKKNWEFRIKSVYNIK